MLSDRAIDVLKELRQRPTYTAFIASDEDKAIALELATFNLVRYTVDKQESLEVWRVVAQGKADDWPTIPPRLTPSTWR